MNPRHRRLLIPGLLLALLVVVVLASVRDAQAADAGPVDAVQVSTIDDARVVESSGLAVSDRFEDLAYTINDSGSDPEVHAVRISTGEVTGTTRVEGVTWTDTEALALDGDGVLWVADTGDNGAVRDEVALYALDEPGPDDATARAQRYPVTYADGATDVETLMVDPTDGTKLLVTKELLSGRVLQLPERLRTDGPNVPVDLEAATVLLATDGAFSPDGRFWAVRNYVSVAVHDATSGELLRTEELPEQPQGETLAFEPSGESYLVGSEGASSALLRVGFDPGEAGAPAPDATPPVDVSAAYEPEGVGRPWLSQVVGVVGVALLAVVSVWMVRRPRRRRW